MAGLVMTLVTLSLDIGLESLGKAGTRLASVSQKEVRFGVWEMAWNQIQHEFWFGYGLSTNLAHLSKMLEDWERLDTHNAFLGIWLRLGLFGVLLYLCVVIVVAHTFLSHIQVLHKEAKILTMIFIGIFIALFIGGLGEENLSSRGNIQQAYWAISAVFVVFISRSHPFKIMNNL
jgi:O-antigen ligase